MCPKNCLQEDNVNHKDLTVYTAVHYVVGLVISIVDTPINAHRVLNLDFVTKGAFPNIIDCCNTNRVECSQTNSNIQSGAIISTRHRGTYFRECVEIIMADSVASDGSIAINTLDRVPSDSDFNGPTSNAITDVGGADGAEK